MPIVQVQWLLDSRFCGNYKQGRLFGKPRAERQAVNKLHNGRSILMILDALRRAKRRGPRLGRRSAEAMTQPSLPAFPDDIFSDQRFVGRWKSWTRKDATDFWMPGFHPFRISYHPGLDLYISAHIRKGAVWEPLETAVLLSLLTSGSVFYDIGAAIGWYSIIAALKVGQAGRVIACEPERDNYQLLRLNLRQNELSNVTAIKCAVADRSGWGRVYRSKENFGDHRLDVPMPNWPSHRTRIATLIDLVKQGYPPPDVMKIDTQGSEAKILHCLPELCAINPQLSVVLEFWPLGLAQCGSSYQQLLGMFEGLDFELFVLDEIEKTFAPATLAEIAERAEREMQPPSNWFVNLVALSPSARQRLPARDYVEKCLQLAASW
jgi:FkbM family methyltransferase